ncbi:VOC family protein [Cellulomonas fimi]|uniref:Glyoxalase/bleomycin resistance protein/dioxygenase n=1 Tax=Cellulomonas fimi (strain ATCC 484 / DSM 20113 / JCM 1341 / CCUG 24087 / LMG 16345 / NBRC 15513 / NCIMB 8980 / NCTC 7547 / NRS-133) TaxID=590998 RepID=F4GY36_CELFA|nr:VOC family protein [Cellulomonas fimi]AEE44704.1 Glyoxalase/bleomycin resistance protein/dioxygenase [Cellulomonas fimi ATCC 484]NNH06153.1 glyoxalase [Cellulomonas fimi]VEH27057.1 Predicted lactoylglutathione lyase [Cellulomonas fimi]
MTSIQHVTLEVTDTASADTFYRTVLGADVPVRTRASDAPSTGFRGFTLGVDLHSPADVDAVVERAHAAGARVVKRAEAQPWGGYSGVVEAPDGTVWKVATAAPAGTAPTGGTVERTVLLLGVGAVAAATAALVERGFEVAKDYGEYVELEPGDGRVTLGLYERTGLAAEFGVDPQGSGSHRLAIGTDGTARVDADGFVWEPVAAAAD